MAVRGRWRAIRSTAGLAPAVLRTVLTRPRALAVVLATTVAYLGLFLVVIGDLFVQPGAGYGVVVVDDPLTRAFRPGPGPFTHEAVALVSAGSVLYLFSPLNLLLGLAVAGLVGLNLGVAYLALTQPAACGIEAGTGLVASVPALLSGGACCAPAVFLALGITASGTLLTAFTWLLPLGFVLLVGSLGYLLTKVSPAAVRSAGPPSQA